MKVVAPYQLFKEEVDEVPTICKHRKQKEFLIEPHFAQLVDVGEEFAQLICLPAAESYRAHLKLRNALDWNE